jgi:hypothetical protein
VVFPTDFFDGRQPGQGRLAAPVRYIWFPVVEIEDADDSGDGSLVHDTFLVSMY